MLKVHQVSKRYRRKTVLDHCSFELLPGRILGVFGHNGCGKSTLFRIIAGIITADEGSVKTDQEVIGYMPEQRSLLIDLSLMKQAGFLGQLKHLDEATIDLNVRNLAQTFGFTELIDRPLKTLSKGNQQKAQLILTLIHEPTILILDEPFNGLDVKSQRELAQWIRTYAQKGNMVLMSSHQLDPINGLCDEILILDHGKTLRQGPLQTLRESVQQYSVKVNADSNWKDLTLPYASLQAQDNLIEYRFQSLVSAKKAVSAFLKDRSVQSVHLELVALSELIVP